VKFRIYKDNECIYGFGAYTGDLFTETKRLKTGTYKLVLSYRDWEIKTEIITVK
jgi:hypothetical protein